MIPQVRDVPAGERCSRRWGPLPQVRDVPAGERCSRGWGPLPQMGDVPAGGGRCTVGPGTCSLRLPHQSLASPGPGAMTEWQRHLPYTIFPESQPATEVLDPFWLASLVNPTCSSLCAPFFAVGIRCSPAHCHGDCFRAPFCAGPGDTGPKVRPSAHLKDPT